MFCIRHGIRLRVYWQQSQSSCSPIWSSWNLVPYQSSGHLPSGRTELQENLSVIAPFHNALTILLSYHLDADILLIWCSTTIYIVFRSPPKSFKFNREWFATKQLKTTLILNTPTTVFVIVVVIVIVKCGRVSWPAVPPRVLWIT